MYDVKAWEGEAWERGNKIGSKQLTIGPQKMT